jgi:nitrilase
MARATTIAAVQATPVFLDAAATTAKACALVKEAAGNGAGLVVFPETFIPTYPDWVWRLPSWSDGRFIHRLYDEAVRIPDVHTDAIAAAARDASAYVAIGVNEIDGGTLYNTLVYFAPSGEIVNVHRKLMPTGGERTVWGMGDGSGLGVVDTPFGVLGGLICWENYMPLARAAMYAQGVDVYLAPTWDNGDTWLATLRHIAKEGRCYVVGVAPVLRGSDVPAELRGEEYTADDDDWMSRGHSAVVGPDGEFLAGPVVDREEILYAEVDPAVTRHSRREFDSIGHYARPDVLQLIVNTTMQRPVRFTSEP